MSEYTIGEIVVWLLLAAALGFVLGWIMRELFLRAGRGPADATGVRAPVRVPDPAAPTGPAEQAPAQAPPRALAKKTPAKKTPAKKTPAKKAAAKKTAAKKTTARKTTKRVPPSKPPGTPDDS